MLNAVGVSRVRYCEGQKERAVPPSRTLSLWLIALVAHLGVGLFPAGTLAQSGGRVALVIGNGAYAHLGRLQNPPNDAQLIASTLQALGFRLVGGRAQTDLDRAGFERAIREFGGALPGAAVGLFYYAGHGLAVQGTNYLVPVGANPRTSADADLELVSADSVLKQMEVAGSKLNIMILDACRNNPFGGRGLRDSGQGLATMRAPRGTLISYATQPGNVALDGSGGNSPYTSALAQAMRRPGIQVLELFNQVGLAVDRSTGGQQQPWVSSSPLEGAFYFSGSGPAAPAPAVAAVAAPPADPELVFWQSVAASKNAADFDEYLRHFPNGRFAGLARNRVSALRTAPAATPQPALAVARPSAPTAAMTPSPGPAPSTPAQPVVAALPREPAALFERGEMAQRRRDFGQAMSWYQRAADAGDDRAMNQIGAFYQNGWGVARNYADAMRWYRRAADRGNAAGFANIGFLYRHGLGVARDDGEGLRWYLEAAKRGNPQAMTNVGALIERGLGAPRDLGAAAEWYEQAAALGDEAANSALRRLGR